MTVCAATSSSSARAKCSSPIGPPEGRKIRSIRVPDFGEPLLREVYAETTREVDGLEAGLEAISGCHRRIVLLHYSPIPETLVGEPETIWAFLGSSRLAAPIGAHRPDLVLHGHAHRGSFAGELGPVPVRNVAVHVLGKDFEIFEV